MVPGVTDAFSCHAGCAALVPAADDLDVLLRDDRVEVRENRAIAFVQHEVGVEPPGTRHLDLL
jgi:hypothetical protein